jgi:hypothetical protein
MEGILILLNLTAGITKLGKEIFLFYSKLEVHTKLANTGVSYLGIYLPTPLLIKTPKIYLKVDTSKEGHSVDFIVSVNMRKKCVAL